MFAFFLFFIFFYFSNRTYTFNIQNQLKLGLNRGNLVYLTLLLLSHNNSYMLDYSLTEHLLLREITSKKQSNAITPCCTSHNKVNSFPLRTFLNFCTWIPPPFLSCLPYFDTICDWFLFQKLYLRKYIFDFQHHSYYIFLTLKSRTRGAQV